MTDRCRVLHVINGEHYSGAERVQDLLAARLPESGFEVVFACVKPDKFPQARQTPNVSLFEVPMRSRFDLLSARRLAAVIRSEECTLVHAHTPRAALVGRLAAWMTGRPFVYHVHSPTVRDTTHRFRNWLNNRIERFSLLDVDRLVCVSRSLAEHMRQLGYRSDRIVVVPNGVPRMDVSTKLPDSAADWVLGCVALFRPRKGLEVLIDALARLRDQGLPVRLRAVGPFETVDYERAIREQVAKLKLEPFIDWTGFTRDVPSELARMNLFVLPSLFGEGLPMVVLEAMAVGLPVVGTQVEGVPEAIRHEVDGVLAQPGDATDLAQRIASVVRGDLDWQRLSRSARQRQAESFSDQSMALGVADVYRSLLPKPEDFGRRASAVVKLSRPQR